MVQYGINLLIDFECLMDVDYAIYTLIKYKYNKKIPSTIKERLVNASMAAATLDKEMSAIHQEMLKIDENCDTEIIHGDPMENEVFLKKY